MEVWKSKKNVNPLFNIVPPPLIFQTPKVCLKKIGESFYIKYDKPYELFIQVRDAQEYCMNNYKLTL